MNELIALEAPEDVLPEYRDSPIERLIAFHNFAAPLTAHERAELFIGMCMDHRKSLRMPDNFAYVMRTGGANLRPIEFQLSFAIAVGGVRAIALIGHSDCGMVNLSARRQAFIEGLEQNGGWNQEPAADHFDHFAPLFEIGNAVEFTRLEAARLRVRYPGALVAPLHYRVEDGRLYQVRED